MDIVIGSNGSHFFFFFPLRVIVVKNEERRNRGEEYKWVNVDPHWLSRPKDQKREKKKRLHQSNRNTQELADCSELGAAVGFFNFFQREGDCFLQLNFDETERKIVTFKDGFVSSLPLISNGSHLLVRKSMHKYIYHQPWPAK